MDEKRVLQERQFLSSKEDPVYSAPFPQHLSPRLVEDVRPFDILIPDSPLDFLR
jgi:hypothetical protein